MVIDSKAGTESDLCRAGHSPRLSPVRSVLLCSLSKEVLRRMAVKPFALHAEVEEVRRGFMLVLVNFGRSLPATQVEGAGAPT
jgi:hypothetical protein